MDAHEMVNRIRHGKDLTDAEWLDIKAEILDFLDSDAPKEEKELFAPFGYLEVVCMMCDDFGE